MFSKSSSELRSAFSLPLLRIMPGMQARVQVHSESVVFFSTHWFDRSYVCPGEGCDACSVNTPRTKGYFVGRVEIGDAWKTVLVEAVPGSIMRLQDACRLEGSVFGPGSLVTAFRRAKNQPIRFNLAEGSFTIDPRLKSDHTILAAAAVLFGLPLPKRAENVEEYVARAVPVARQLLVAPLRSAS